MAGGGGGGGTAATEKLIRSAQKSTNQLKALLAQGGAGSRVDSSGAVEAVLSDISDSLSQALASLLLGAFDDRLLPAAPPEASLSSYGQCVVNSGRRSVSKRKGQRRSRVDASSRRIILQRGHRDDSYPWRKYGQKDILGARYARNYYRCAQRSGCSARK